MLFGLSNKPVELPTKENAAPDRPEPPKFRLQHFVSANPIAEPFPEHLSKAIFGMGCFWGAERLFWQLPGVYSTAAGYAGGITVNPSYEDVCSGMSGHTEVVLVVFDREQINFKDLLTVFWESHDPTQGMRQGNDRGTQYRSAIYTTSAEQQITALNSSQSFQKALSNKSYPSITTEISNIDTFYYAEDYHQQYLAKNPNGYCGLAGTGACYQAE